MTAVLDSSAVLAVIFDEPGADAVRPGLLSASAVIGAVNLTEVASRLVNAGYSDADAAATLDSLSALVRGLDAETAILAGLMRRETRDRGLSPGDRACLALARRLDVPALTADRAWEDLDIGVEIEVIR